MTGCKFDLDMEKLSYQTELENKGRMLEEAAAPYQ
jgi:hypothetical protein